MKAGGVIESAFASASGSESGSGGVILEQQLSSTSPSLFKQVLYYYFLSFCYLLISVRPSQVLFQIKRITLGESFVSFVVKSWRRILKCHE